MFLRFEINSLWFGSIAVGMVIDELMAAPDQGMFEDYPGNLGKAISQKKRKQRNGGSSKIVNSGQGMEHYAVREMKDRKVNQIHAIRKLAHLPQKT
jgi:hypothetical protein